MEIQQETSTIVTRTFMIKLTEAELTAALVDARPLQRELRRARNSDKQASNWATSGYAGHTARNKVQTHAKRGRPRKSARVIAKSAQDRKVSCPGCGESFAPQGLGPHQRRCPPFQLKKIANEARSKVMAA